MDDNNECRLTTRPSAAGKFNCPGEKKLSEKKVLTGIKCLLFRVKS